MDDFYAINFVKTEFREAFNSGDAERLITLLDPEFVYTPDGVEQTMAAAAVETIRKQFLEFAGAIMCNYCRSSSKFVSRTASHTITGGIFGRKHEVPAPNRSS